MALVVHGDGKNIRIQPAIAVFLALMGLVFLADATSGSEVTAATVMVGLGCLWYYLSCHFSDWREHH